MDLPTDYTEKHLLVVDDEPEIVKSLYRQFRKQYTVHMAHSAKEASEIMKEQTIHVVVSDQRMPNVTGVEFLSEVKKDYPETVRLILTGYSDIDAVINAINDGNIFRYITKPWNPDELNIVVDKAFKHSFLTYQNRMLIDMLQEHSQQLEHKVAERTQALTETNKRLEWANEEKNRFLGIAAHDLRNPIGAAYNMAELCEFQLRRNEYDRLLSYTETIRETCKFALSLINNLLDYSKIEAGKLNLSLNLADYRQVVDKALRFNQALAQTKDIQIIGNINLDDPLLCIDVQTISQVINNLLGNALKFSPNNTTITVSVSQEQNHIVTEISDEGPGLQAEDYDKLFLPFSTASARTTSGEKKTGLGLAICKKVIDQHKGIIGAKANHTGGALFYFTIPRGL